MAYSRFDGANILEKIKNSSFMKIDPADKVSPFEFSFTLENKDTQTAIAKHIQTLRQLDFDYAGYQPDDITPAVLIKDLRDKTGMNPIHPREAEIQALRYLRGILIIHENSDFKNEGFKQDFLNDIREIYEKMPAATSITEEANNTHLLGEQFAQRLQKELNIDIEKARKQVTMARDLGILSEDHPAIYTISKSTNEEVTIEQSKLVKVSEDYYAELSREKPWFIAAKKYAGFKSDNPTWMDKFFSADNLIKLQEKGVPAPPSARWLPLPANNQYVTNEVINTATNETRAHASFIRMGITTAFNVKNIKEQTTLASAQLEEMIANNINAARNQYESLYHELQGTTENRTFFVSYQTLLTPHRLEASTYPKFKDNNAKFVEMAKEAMDSFAKKHPEYTNVQFVQTNSNINARASWWSAKQFASDKATRRGKLVETANLLALPQLFQQSDELKRLTGFITGSIKTTDTDIETMKRVVASLPQKIAANTNIKNPVLKAEVVIRLQAAFHLRLLLQKKSPYAGLNAYQRNIMMASLEYLTLGSQALTLMGCKSARDRTAVEAAAIKTMMEHPETMADWQKLNEGIIISLTQGHHFRSMSYHNANVKIDDVHKEFMAKLEDKVVSVKTNIKALKPFSKALPKPATSSNKTIFQKLRGLLRKSSKEEVRVEKRVFITPMMDDFDRTLQGRQKQESVLRKKQSEVSEKNDPDKSSPFNKKK